ncbi:restriction endonuclease subunit S [Clostridium butyricum]|uniref:restriction endonuclease subunit S n=1 Tax=Clostridium butyricum TaxID=1492 RepID=UPI00071E9DD1|nr:restriction endonuclease subunit S [Clostridium butyricum]ALS17560.1 type I restriction endonuclease subunit S [Clostridium butyricum]MDM8130808.1 restriction endonuclease subunit S [Clostridium butyricum]MDM8229945.1 restriction endonuclease subunit S [Clostridium butyricum]
MNKEILRLKDVCEINGGYAFKSSNFNNKGINIIRIGDIYDNRVNISESTVSIDANINDYSKFIISKGDILVALSGATTGKYGIYDYNEKSLLNQRVAKIKPNEKVKNKYLYHYMNKLQNNIYDSALGCAQPNISPSEIGEMNIYVPNIYIQEKVIAILDKSQELINKRKAQIEALDELVKSQFIEMFGDLNSNSKGWNIINFNEFAVIDTNMTKDFEKYSDYPHIGIDSIEKNTGNILEYQLVKDSSLKSGKYLFDERHIIYSKIRPNLNKVALPWFKGVCSADAYPILCLDGIVDKNYLGYVLRSEFFLSYILAFSGRTNIPKVNKEQLKGFNMPTPPIELQNQFADFVKQTDKLKFEMEKSLKELEDNFNSLMQKAFNGQLFNK